MQERNKERILIVASSPHIRDKKTTRIIMLEVIIALLPALVASFIFFGYNAVRVVAVSLISCLLTEFIITRVRKKSSSLCDLSAVITALIFAFSLPPSLPSYAVALGGIFAIAIGKMIFGGLGHNIFNPAMVGRAFLMSAFPVLMTSWTAPVSSSSESNNTANVDEITTATPLVWLKPGESAERKLPDAWLLFVGRKAGSLGETSVLALLIGAAFLILRGTIDVAIPVGMIGSAFVFGGLAYLINPDRFVNPMFHLGAGALIFGAFFIATDPVTCPLSKSGRWIFGIGCGLLTMFIRQFGTYPEGVMFSILIMNGLSPLIDRWTIGKPLGGHFRG